MKLTPAKRVKWQECVIAMETRDDIWVLAQLLDSYNIAFFNAFAASAKFSESDWENAELLYVTPAMTGFVNSVEKFKTDLPPKSGIPIPNVFISCQMFADSKKTILWEGTKHERRLIVPYGGTLVSDPDPDQHEWPMEHNILIPQIRLNSRKVIDSYELSGLAIAPYTNYRLHLCYLLGKNVDPCKDLFFRRPLPLEYLDVINGLYPEDHF